MGYGVLSSNEMFREDTIRQIEGVEYRGVILQGPIGGGQPL